METGVTAAEVGVHLPIARRTAAKDLRLERVEKLEDLRDDWRDLAEANENLFATWEWVSTWWRHFGRDKELLATRCRDASGRVVAILPLYVWRRRPLRIVRMLGHGPSDELAPICAPQHRAPVARALRQALARERSDVFVGDHVPAELGWCSLLGARTLGRAPGPTLVAANGWEAFLATRSANFRKQVRSSERRLAREHRLTIRLTSDRAELQRDLDSLFQLHRARWSVETEFAACERFHRDFAAQALERGWLRLWLLELDGKPAAAGYGFRFAGAEWDYQGGRDPRWDRLSIGFVLQAHAIRAALDDGVRRYKLLRGGEGYKYRFTNRDDACETIALPSGVAGRAAVAGVRVWRSRVRRQLADVRRCSRAN